MNAKTNPSGFAKLVAGIACTVLALALYMWVREHSPYAGLGELVLQMDTYIIEEPFYSMILLFAGGIGSVGILFIILGALALVKR